MTATAPAPERCRPSVLFVDDDPAMLAALRRMLWPERQRWDLSFAGDGAAALASMTSQAYAVIVTDYRMPGMTGDQLLAAVRTRHPGTARVVLSGHVDEWATNTVAELAHQVLDKPCAPAQLIGCIERLLERSHSA